MIVAINLHPYRLINVLPYEDIKKFNFLTSLLNNFISNYKELQAVTDNSMIQMVSVLLLRVLYVSVATILREYNFI